MNKLKNFFQNKTVWVLLAVLAVGFFLRAFNHHDFLRFNPDQSRDAGLVRDVLDGKESWPVLGPQAGGTDFKLGPIFYHVQIISAKIFGSAPDKLAYPDLFLSILSLPLLHIFLRKIFNRKITLATVAVFAVSFYAIKYARFAWNPNSTPFYVLLFLYSLHELSSPESERKWLWALVLGIASGIGIQLHSLLLFTFPIVLVLYLGYLLWKKNPAWKLAPIVILAALAMNISQITGEVRSGGKNFQAFTKGLESKSSREGSLPYKFILNSVCHVQAGSLIILPVGNNNECDFIDAAKNIQKDKLFIPHVAFAAIFSLGGCFLFFWHFRREDDEKRKRFLGIILLYSSVLFVVLVPLAAEISFRFFLVLEFMPFLFLGFWLKFLGEKFSKLENQIIFAIITILITINVFAVSRQFAYLAGKIPEGRNGFEEITLGEVGYMADFIITHSDGAKDVYLSGKASELFKITKSVQYFTDKSGLDVKNLKKGQTLKPEEKVFAIDVVKDPKGENEAPANAVAAGDFGRIRIYEINR